MVIIVKLYMLKLVPILKSSKLLLVDMKADSSVLKRLKMAGMTQNKQKCLIFIVVPPVRVKNLIS